MNVSSVGGAASLPVPLPMPAAPAGTAPAAAPATPSAAGSRSGSADPSATSDSPAGAPATLRLPGQPASKAKEASAAVHKETPKPKPLPPLKGLTVAEIRAMLGVGMLPAGSDGQTAAQTGTSAPPGTSSPPGASSPSLQSVLSRYA